MITKELEKFLSALDGLVNREAGYSWQVKRRLVEQACFEADLSEALVEFIAWFEEEETNDPKHQISR
jgi:hypothetical protein